MTRVSIEKDIKNRFNHWMDTLGYEVFHFTDGIAYYNSVQLGRYNVIEENERFFVELESGRRIQVLLSTPTRLDLQLENRPSVMLILTASKVMAG